MTASSLIEALGGPAGVGRALGVLPNTVSTWKKRGRIPSAWWHEIVALACSAGIAGVSAHSLKAMNAPVGGQA